MDRAKRIRISKLVATSKLYVDVSAYFSNIFADTSYLLINASQWA